MKKQEVLDAIRDFSEDFPREALEEIQANREGYISELLNSLDYVYHNAKKLYDDGNDYFMHNYAMYLLAEFREKRAFPFLTALLALPEAESDFILGDNLTEGFSRLLFSTFDSTKEFMLRDVIENPELNEWARSAAIGAYELLIGEGIIAKEEVIYYLRQLIYEKLRTDDSDVVFTAIVSCAIEARLVDMLPDIRTLYDHDQVNKYVYGEYDSVMDYIFSKERPRRLFVNNAIDEMEWWACFKNERDDKPKDNMLGLDEMFKAMQKEITRENRVERKPAKVGRNDPCPCGSGKKYKKCCIDIITNTPGVSSLESRYDLLEDYPRNSELFEQLYEKEAIAIDRFVYKALHHRAIPMWVKRDPEQERIGKINYLSAALKLFVEKCRREQIDSFSAYDDRFMVHYRSKDWVRSLAELIEDCDDGSLMAIKRSAEEIMQKYV